MGNPCCPSCGRVMRLKLLATPKATAQSSSGRAKYYVCERCKLKFKAGEEVIRRRK